MQQIVPKLNLFFKVIGGGLLAALIAIIFAQVIMRYCFHAAMAWPEEVAKFLFISIAYAGGVLSMYHNQNLRVDALFGICSPRVVHVLNVLAFAFTSVYCALASWFTYELMLEIKDMEQMAASIDIYIWPTWLPIPIGFAMRCLYSIMHCILTLRGKE